MNRKCDKDMFFFSRSFYSREWKASPKRPSSIWTLIRWADTIAQADYDEKISPFTAAPINVAPCWLNWPLLSHSVECIKNISTGHSGVHLSSGLYRTNTRGLHDQLMMAVFKDLFSFDVLPHHFTIGRTETKALSKLISLHLKCITFADIKLVLVTLKLDHLFEL